MQVSGVVVYLERDEARARAALDVLALERSLELGEPQERFRIPGVLEVGTPQDSRDALRRFEQIVGVERIEVAFVAFAEDEPSGGDGDRDGKEQEAGVQCH